MPVADHPILFCASRHLHAVRPAEGRRVVLAAYCLRLAHSLSKQLSLRLSELGFRLPRLHSDPSGPACRTQILTLSDQARRSLGPPLGPLVDLRARVQAPTPGSLPSLPPAFQDSPQPVVARNASADGSVPYGLGEVPDGCNTLLSAQGPSVELSVPSDFPPQASSQPRFFLDLFAGAAHPVSSAVAAISGDRFEAVDLIHGPQFDLLNDDTFALLCAMADHGVIGAAMAAPICGEHTILKLRPGGPPAVRTPKFLDGLPTNNWDQAVRAQNSALLHDRTREILSRVSAGHGLVLLENPVTSMTFQDPLMQSWMLAEAPFAAQVAACQFGLSWYKRWLFVSNRAEVLELASCCQHGPAAHYSLLGLRDSSGQYVSRLSAEYPKGLACKIAHVVKKFISCHDRFMRLQDWRCLLHPSPCWHLPAVRVEDGAGLHSTAAWLQPQAPDRLAQLRERWSRRLFEDKLCLRLAYSLQSSPDQPPLSESDLDPFVQDALDVLGVSTSDRSAVLSITPGQPLRLHLLQALLECLGDSEAAMCEDLRTGVRVGVGVDITPSDHWPSRDWAPVIPDLQVCEGSWLSASSHPSQVNELLAEELAAGWIEEFSSLEDIRTRYPTVACGRLGLVLAEGRSPRLVVDSSISGVTEACFIPNRMLLPRVADIALCAPVQCVQEDWVLVSLDVRKAHRLVLIHPDDQGLLCFSFEGRFFVSKTLNFGARASAFWWGRLAGALMRITHSLIFLPHFLWDYVDDFLGAFRKATAPLQVGLWVVLFLVLRVPISWRKCAWNSRVKWIGWDICVSSWTVSLPADKQGLDEVLSAPKTKLKTLESLIGRLLWVSGLWKCLRPLLSPLYAALQAIPASCVAVSPALWQAILDAVDDHCVIRSDVSHASFPIGSRVIRVANTATHTKAHLVRMVFQHRRLWVTVQSTDHPFREISSPARDALAAWRAILEASPLSFVIRQPIHLSVLAEADACASEKGCGLGGHVCWPPGRQVWFSLYFMLA